MASQRGMTLVEVLVALAVVGVALGALITGMGNYADYYTRLRDRFWSGNVAWNELAVVQVSQEVGQLANLSGSGTSDQLGLSWKWKLNLEDTPSPTIKLLRLEVDFPGGEGASRLSTMVMEGAGFNRGQLKPGNVRY